MGVPSYNIGYIQSEIYSFNMIVHAAGPDLGGGGGGGGGGGCGGCNPPPFALTS